jgi:hypothetical protein
MAKHHVKWVTVIGVALMLIALFAYLASMDEAVPNDLPVLIKKGK